MKRNKILQRSFSDDFISKMKNAVVMSHHKYGDLTNTKRDIRIQRNELRNAEYRLAKYKKTGNPECLVDAANFLMFEYMEMLGHFLSTEGDASDKIISEDRM